MKTKPIFVEERAPVEDEQGGPITITHPRMTRYFMSIPEACALVLITGTLSGEGELFMFDMGKPVSIMELACEMITRTGRTPHVDIPIVFTGGRPGEKLEEDGMDDFTPVQKYPPIWVNRTIDALPSAPFRKLRRMLSRRSQLRDKQVKNLLDDLTANKLNYSNTSDFQ